MINKINIKIPESLKNIQISIYNGKWYLNLAIRAKFETLVLQCTWWTNTSTKEVKYELFAY